MRILAMLFLCSCFLVSCTEDLCGDKERFMKNFEQLVDETRDASSDYKKADWEKVEERFEKLTKDCYQAHKDDMTSREKRTFWNHAVKVMIVKRTQNFDLQLKEDDIDIDFGSDEDLEYITTELEEVFEGTGDEIKEIMEDFLDHEAPILIDKAMEGLENFADELKKALEEREEIK